MNTDRVRNIAKLDSAFEVILPALRAALTACQDIKRTETKGSTEHTEVARIMALGTLVKGASILSVPSLHLLTGIIAALLDLEVYPHEESQEDKRFQA